MEDSELVIELRKAQWREWLVPLAAVVGGGAEPGGAAPAAAPTAARATPTAPAPSTASMAASPATAVAAPAPACVRVLLPATCAPAAAAAEGAVAEAEPEHQQPGESAWRAMRTPEFWAMRKAGVVHGATEVVDPLAQTVGEARGGAGFLVKSFDESWHAAMWQ